jgi:hypothetical protein
VCDSIEMNKRSAQFLRTTLVTLLLIIGITAQAQKKRTIEIKNEKYDTLGVYKTIKKSAYKYKFTKFLFHAVFVDPSPLKYEKKALSDKQVKVDANTKYKGAIIRSIEITVLDPFGYSANDTIYTKTNPLQKVANKTHIKTINRVIRNRLLFRRSEPVDLLKIKESERLLREAAFIRDARIFLSGNTDSVDIIILVHDKWTLDPSVSVSGVNSGNLRLRDRNLFGLGHTFEQNIGYYSSSGYALSGRYNFSNIKNSYISSNIFYTNSSEVTSIGISVDRAFYSVITKYAGGLAFSKTWGVFKNYDSLLAKEFSHPLDYYTTDVWLAKSQSPSNGKSITQQSSKIIGGLRYYNNTFLTRPAYSIDTSFSNVNRTVYLACLGFSLRKYYKDQFIYRFGANEDIPEGLAIKILHGLEKRELGIDRNYSAFEISHGKHFDKLGYLSGNFTYGTYYKPGIKNNATLRAGFFYFSDLSLERRWYLRQFISSKYVYGFNKTNFERITLTAGELYGFNSGLLNGTGKLVLNFETVAYAPYNLIGFRFAPVVLIGFGMLKTENHTLRQSPVYQAYSIGLLVRNESLLNSSFEITFGAYPNQPGENKAVYKLNPVTSFTLKVRSFEISKPEPVVFD